VRRAGDRGEGPCEWREGVEEERKGGGVSVGVRGGARLGGGVSIYI
jgi:hypothetical protein